MRDKDAEKADEIMWKQMLKMRDLCLYCGTNVAEKVPSYTNKERTQFLLLGLCSVCYGHLIKGEKDEPRKNNKKN